MRYSYILGMILIMMSCAVRLKAQDIPTQKEVFDFDIGDIMEYYYECDDTLHGMHSCFRHAMQLVVKRKWYSSDRDTLFYEWSLFDRNMDSDQIMGGDYQSLYTELDSGVVSLYTHDTEQAWNRIIDTLPLHKYSGRQVVGLLMYSASSHKYMELSKGLGITNVIVHSDVNENYTDSMELIYYKKGTEEWGRSMVRDY